MERSRLLTMIESMCIMKYAPINVGPTLGLDFEKKMYFRVSSTLVIYLMQTTSRILKTNEMEVFYWFLLVSYGSHLTSQKTIWFPGHLKRGPQNVILNLESCVLNLSTVLQENQQTFFFGWQTNIYKYIYIST